MRNFARVSLVMAGSAALVGSMALPASAAEIPPGHTTTTIEVEAGLLTIGAPESLALTGVAPGGTATGTLVGVKVSDLTADLTGWTVTVALTDFTSVTSGTSFPAAPSVYSTSNATVTGTANVIASSPTVENSTVQIAEPVTGNNTATWNADIAVEIPSDALAADDYQTVLRHSVS